MQNLKTPMILIVDDISKNIQVLAEFLKPEGYQLAFAQSGKAAISQAQKQPIDLVLLDVMMPEMDGFEVCSHLKNSPDTKDIPIIFLTGKVETESVVHGFELGAVDYVTKPFNRGELLARVRTHLELRRAREHIQDLFDLIKEELGIASSIQKDVMRVNGKVPFLTSSLIFEPFGEVSGDMVDFSKNGDEELYFFLGDATGHGIAAALLTMMVPFILDGKKNEESTSQMVTNINNAMANRKIDGKFVTGIYAKIKEDGSLFVCNAGHPPQLIVPADQSPLVEIAPNGLPMGIFSSEELIAPEYKEREFRLKQGDKFFFYTDGITEWSNPQEEQFGLKRLKEVIEVNRDLKVEPILEKLMKQIEIFSEGKSGDDDYTIIGFEYLGVK
ncbi:MAG: SpoIIE family protein phosphatase [SAR324 cluster bacterium]|nr:SpoIIE family protein phosphatase [SAR324 cluster bacterium]